MSEENGSGRGESSRRTFLAAASGGLASAVALSGCVELGDGTDASATTGEVDETTTPEAGTPTDTPLSTTVGTATERRSTESTATATERTTTAPSETATERTTTTSTATTTAGGPSSPSERTLELVTDPVETLDPIAAVDAASESVVQQVFDAPFAHQNGEAAVENGVVRSLAVSGDFRTYTFELWEGVEFHDGTELTAEDVVYSFERLAASPASNRSYLLLEYGLHVEHETDGDGAYVPGSLAVAAVDEYTVECRLRKPFAPALDVFASSACSVLPRGTVDDVDVIPVGSLADDATETVDGDRSQAAFAASPVGAGPFAFDDWERGERVAVERFADYYEGAATSAGVSWRVLVDDEAAHEYWLSADADVLAVPTSKYDPGKVNVEGTDDLGRQYGTYGPMENGRTANYLAVATLNTQCLAFDCEKVPRPVRRAVAYAVDQSFVANRMFKGRGKPATHLTPPGVYPGGSPGYDAHAEGYPYGRDESRLDEARRVMEDAGYGPDDPFELTLTAFADDAWQGQGMVVRDKLVSSHVEVTLEAASAGVIAERARSGDLECFSMEWVLEWAAPSNVLAQVVPADTDDDGGGTAGGFHANWDGSSAASAVETARDAWAVVEANPEPTRDAKDQRNDAYETIEEAVWTDAPVVPLFHERDERFWYDWADVPRFGSLGASRQTFDDVTLDRRDR